MRTRWKPLAPLLAEPSLAPPAAQAERNCGDVTPNFAGVGLGFAPAYQGSRETVFGAAPGGRIGLGSIPFRLRGGVSVMGDVTGQYTGLSIIPSASIWVPLSPQVFVGAGALARFASASQNRYFFGVSQVGSAASGLPVFTPGSGLATVTAWPAVVWRLNANWAVGGGLAYTSIMGDAADSPIIQRGSRDPLVGGIGIAYTW